MDLHLSCLHSSQQNLWVEIELCKCINYYILQCTHSNVRPVRLWNTFSSMSLSPELKIFLKLEMNLGIKLIYKLS